MIPISKQQPNPAQNPSSAAQPAAPVPTPSSSSGTSQQAAAGRSFGGSNRRPGSIASAGTAHHGKSDSVSPANGKGPILPAVPSLGGPTIVNGNNAVSPTTQPFEHGRKSSITISAAGAIGQMPNGGPAAGSSSVSNGHKMQFGQYNAASPNIANSTPYVPPNTGALAVASSPNPRITSPQTSPSPIPQPAVSGGRPASSFYGQGNGPTFGNLGPEESARQSRVSISGGMPTGSLTSGLQPTQLRRESSQQSNNDMANGNMNMNGGRSGYPPQGGRGRAYAQQMNPPIPYSPNQGYRNIPSAPRSGQGMPSPYLAQARPMGAYSPAPTRSPSMAHPQPMHQGGSMPPMQSPAMQGQHYAGFPQMGHPQAQYMYSPDPTFGYYQYGMQPHMSMPQYPPQPSPRSSFGGQHGPPQYTPGQYNQPQPMSRTPSGVPDRPASTVVQPQTPMTPAVSLQQQSQQPPQPQQQQQARAVSSPAPNSTEFRRPKKGGIVIKDPSTGLTKTFDKGPDSPAVGAPSKSPVTVSSASTPPSRTPSHADSHARPENKGVSTSSEMVRKFKEDIANKLVADKAEEQRAKQGSGTKEDQEKEEPITKTAEEPKVVDDVPTPGEPVAPADTGLVEEEKSKTTNDSELVAPKVEEPQVDVSKDTKSDEPKRELQDEAELKTTKETEPEPDLEDDEYWARYEEEERRKEEEAEKEYQAKKKAQAEEKARQEAEAAARLDEELKRAEKEAEAREEERLKKLEIGETEDKQEKKDLFASLKRSENAFKATETSSVDSPASGVATPASDASSMGPPVAKATGQPKQKPAALKLKTAEQVEAPQPSAALQSLRSARFLTKIDDHTYPAAIASPNPALNSAAPMGKFRYDKNFLMQFQNVFTEKPSETWSDRVKETVGDTSETPASARLPRGTNTMPSRSASRTSVMGPNAFQGTMGAFGNMRSVPNNSQARFEQSTRDLQRGNPAMRYNPNTAGFPMQFGPPMQRTPSTNSMGLPHSPRNNTRDKTGSRGPSKTGPKRDAEKEAKNMPLTAGQEVKPIEITATGWKPRSIGVNASAGPLPGGDGYLAPDVVQRKVKAALNKMTPTTFDKISKQILDITMQSRKETDGRTLRQVIQLTFEKATDEAHWAQMYAEFCGRMLHNMTPEIKDETLGLDKNGNVNSGSTLFRKYLLNRCQQDFEAGWKSKLPDKPEGETAEAAMLSDEYYAAAAAKRRGLGLVKFIGELYKLGMLTSRIMHMCVHRLLDYEGVPDEAEVESLTSLLKTIGDSLDAEEKSRASMDVYFQRIDAMLNVEGLPSRLKFMLMDIVDLRKAGWKGKGAGTKGPATLDEVRAQAAAAEREKEAQRAAEAPRRGGGGGGRMPMGRGDARGASQASMMPPPQQNSVGMDDLRRLQRSGSRQANVQGSTSFGPGTSMFGSAMRGSNTRKSTLGPFGRTGDESGHSSRTATPPAMVLAQKKEDKEPTRTTNTFSALESLNQDEPNDNPASPPSAASSPSLTNTRPVQQRQRSKSPLKDDEAT